MSLEGYRLCKAVSGDWKEVREVFRDNPEERLMVTKVEWNAALNMSVNHNKLLSLVEILKLMPPEGLDYDAREVESTALHAAALLGYTEFAKVLVNTNPNLTQVRDKKGRVPLELAIQAVTVGQMETVKYLYLVTRDIDPSPFIGHDGARLLSGAIAANLYDTARLLVQRFPKLVTDIYRVEDVCGLEAMTQRRLAFRSGSQLSWWKQHIYSSIDVDKDASFNHGMTTTIFERDAENDLESSLGTQIIEANTPKRSKVSSTSGDKGIMPMFVVAIFTRVLHIKQYLFKQKLMHKHALALVSEMFGQSDNVTDVPEIVEYFRGNSGIIKTAIKHGSIEVVAECLKRFPFLIWHDLGGQTMIQMAVLERNEIALSLIIKTSGEDKLDLINKKDKDGNTLLHYAAYLAPPFQLNSVSGAVLLMQRELQWFKGIQSILTEENKVFKRNKKGDIAEYIFTTEHKNLVKNGEKWMKDTSGSCMVVATLIATVTFAAAFTVPGGNINDTNSSKNGIPVFLRNTSFVVFAIADALALLSSITSVLMFLAIYTSRYAEQDFLISLPRKMIIGLATLFVSMATIVIAFGASLSIVLGDEFPWAPIPIALFSCIPPISFAFLQLPLFVEMVRCTFWSRIFENITTTHCLF